MEEFSFLKNVRLLSTPQRYLIKCGNKKKRFQRFAVMLTKNVSVLLLVQYVCMYVCM